MLGALLTVTLSVECPLGFSGEKCDHQYCNIQEINNEKIYCQGSGKCSAITQKCECYQGFISSGFNCIVEHAVYLDHTVSWVCLSIGIVLAIIGLIYIIYQYRNGNSTEDNIALVEIE
ncbi:Hypothetical_protein [Hexamita inflata]|uniref:Hypothetical_protein n=1 Tax=Hexamita inflata TaxID=28002 RepID=A0AA86P4P9_9EUKA|nr:Hypothetical protein HINF_LOCUS19243 [Hexamita inflata]